MLNIGISTPTYPNVHGYGGIGTYTQSLAEGLHQLGHQVHVLVMTNAQPESDIKMNGVIVHVRPRKSLRGIDRLMPGISSIGSISIEMLRLIKRYALDIVEFPNWDGLGLAMPFLTTVAVVTRLHTSAGETARIEGKATDRHLKWELRRERWQCRNSRALVTHREAHASTMAEDLQVDRRKIRVIPHGIPTFPEFSRASKQSDAKSVVYVGRLEKRKGVIDLLHAASQVLEECPETSFFLIGEDRKHCPGNRHYENYAQEELPASVVSRMNFLGRQPQRTVDEYMQTADVCVAPSIYESFGLVLPEAMRWGTPVVSTNVGGIPEIVENETTGLLVPPGRPDELASSLIRLLKNPSESQKIGTNGRAMVEESFSTHRMSSAVGNFYAEVINKRKAHA